jgi:hypothetical protein
MLKEIIALNLENVIKFKYLGMTLRLGLCGEKNNWTLKRWNVWGLDKIT